MNLSGWGQYPSIDAEVSIPLVDRDITSAIADTAGHDALIARGLGRSYGDSALAKFVISTDSMDHFVSFDETSGELRCQAGVSLDQILAVFVPKGWFLPVTPGTKFVTVGGAIASDVHGKNHHIDGTFTEHVSLIRIATVAEGVVDCSRSEHTELFHATCGGMGLTGVILEAVIRLRPIKSSMIEERTVKAANIDETVAIFDDNQEVTYSVAWIDCVATGRNLGRSLVMMGEHADHGGLSVHREGKLAIPFNMPGFLLNRYSVHGFNMLYYNRVGNPVTTRTVHYDGFFYPLDGIHQWNRMYGKNGFTQYQFVLPKEAGLDGMKLILKRIADSGMGSFLSVLKVFGPANANYLSFPMGGYTLALDFKIVTGLFAFLDELDRILADYGGRIYLTKDVRMSRETFQRGYPQADEFIQTRVGYAAAQVFNSLQSQWRGL